MQTIHHTVESPSLPLERTFCYSVPDRLGMAVAGTRALVPFGRRTVTGYILGPGATTVQRRTGDNQLLDSEPLFSAQHTIFING
jgi:primosomal protein N' (replication factor Y)